MGECGERVRGLFIWRRPDLTAVLKYVSYAVELHEPTVEPSFTKEKSVDVTGPTASSTSPEPVELPIWSVHP